MTELEIGGNTYRINNMPAMTQFHVMRKLGPVLPGIVPVLAQAAATLPQADGQEDGGGLTMTWSQLNVRIALLEKSIEQQSNTDKRQDESSREAFARVDARLSSIDAKLDKLVDWQVRRYSTQREGAEK